jgi:hypothetical protein
LYLSETALILDAALRDFKHDRDQQKLQEQANNHNNDANATDNQSKEPPDTDPSLLHEQIDSYLAKTALNLDAALHDFKHAADQQPLYEPTNGNNTTVTAPPPTNKTKVQLPAHMHPHQSPNQPTQTVSQHHSNASQDWWQQRDE